MSPTCDITRSSRSVHSSFTWSVLALHTVTVPAVRVAVKTELSYPKDMIIVFFFTANKIKTMLKSKLFWPPHCTPNSWETISKTLRQCRADQWKTMKTSKNVSLQSMIRTIDRKKSYLHHRMKNLQVKNEIENNFSSPISRFSHHFKSSRSI